MVWQASSRLIHDSARSRYENIPIGDNVMQSTDSDEKPYEIFIGTNYGFKVQLILTILFYSFSFISFNYCLYCFCSTLRTPNFFIELVSIMCSSTSLSSFPPSIFLSSLLLLSLSFPFLISYHLIL